MARRSLPYSIGHEESLVPVAERMAKYGNFGHVFWFHGLPSSGKSTLALHAEQRLFESGNRAIIIDSAFVRLGICAGLSYTPDDRREYVRRIACMATHCARFGEIVLVSAFTPYQEHRNFARSIICKNPEANPDFAELQNTPQIGLTDIFIDAPQSLCELRDPRGIWVKARGGELEPFFPVVDIDFEPPEVEPESIITMNEFTSIADATAELMLIIHRVISLGRLQHGK